MKKIAEYGKGDLKGTRLYLDKQGYNPLAKLLEPLVDDTLHTDFIDDLNCEVCDRLIAHFDEKEQESVTMDWPGICWLENEDKNEKTLYFCSGDCFDRYFGKGEKRRAVTPVREVVGAVYKFLDKMAQDKCKEHCKTYQEEVLELRKILRDYR